MVVVKHLLIYSILFTVTIRLFEEKNKTKKHCPTVPKPPSYSCYFLFCWVSRAAKHLGHSWRFEEPLMILQWFLTNCNEHESHSAPEGWKSKHIHTFSQREPNLETTQFFEGERLVLCDGQISEPWRPHTFSPAQSVCKAEGFFFSFHVSADETPADGEEDTQTHTPHGPGEYQPSAFTIIIVWEKKCCHWLLMVL